jgi:hypothetical protein
MPKQPPHLSLAVSSRPGSKDAQPAVADASEAARYIAEFAAELSAVARHARLDLLAYLLDMARIEAARAGDAAGGKAPRP